MKWSNVTYPRTIIRSSDGDDLPFSFGLLFYFLPAFLNIEAAVAAPAESPLVIVSYLIYEPGGGGYSGQWSKCNIYAISDTAIVKPSWQ